jgi:hypothetical protein
MAHQNGKLGPCPMPEDISPGFSQNEQEKRLVYFTLPMALNYQRDSYKLWQAALLTYQDKKTQGVFSVKSSTLMSEEELRYKLLKYKLALQPNKHISTWKTLANTINYNWGSLENLFKSVNHDFLKLREVVQSRHKKNFPYLSGPKIFNYWSFIISTYGKIPLTNRQFIEIAPDTHITKCSVKLGLITENEANRLPKEQISHAWRQLLKGSDITPIDMHTLLWFWSRSNFQFDPFNP